MSLSLRTASASLFLCAVGAAPLAYGATRPAPFFTVAAAAAAAGVAWALHWFRIRSAPPVPASTAIGAALVAAVALRWAVRPPHPSIPAFTLNHFARVEARWPYGLVVRSPGALTAWAAILVLSLLALSDLLREPQWRRRLAGVIVATGAAVAFVGLLQNATHAPAIYWDKAARTPGMFFGTFYHHTSAGAYLNTVWPVGLGLALDRWRAPQAGARRAAGWALAGAVLVFAAHLGHVSRLPQVLALLLLAAAAAWMRLGGRFLASGRRLWPALAGCALIVLLLAGGGDRIGRIRARWNQLDWRALGGGAAAAAHPIPPDQWPRRMRPDLFVPSDHRDYPLGDRGEAYAVAVRAMADHPWFGWGPGEWIAASAAHTADPFIRTFYLMLQFTHEDYLQTLVEWGAIGAAGWTLLFPGALWRGLRALRLHPENDFLAAGACLGLAAVFLQSLIDFPLQIPAIQLNLAALAALAIPAPRAAV